MSSAERIRATLDGAGQDLCPGDGEWRTCDKQRARLVAALRVAVEEIEAASGCNNVVTARVMADGALAAIEKALRGEK